MLVAWENLKNNKSVARRRIEKKLVWEHQRLE